MAILLRDLRHALRALHRDASGLLVAVCVLALAIGANTALFSVVEAVVLRSLPFEAPERLVDIGMTKREFATPGRRGGTPSRYVLELLQERSMSFAAIAGQGGAAPVLTGRGDPVRLRTQTVGPEFFTVLAARPLLGRGFVAEEGAGGRRAVVLGHALWASRFGSDPSVVGRPVMLDGQPFDVVGVMPRGMDYPDRVDLLQTRPAPAAAPAPAEPAAQGGTRITARLRPGVSIAQAEAELAQLFAAVGRDVPALAGHVAVLTPALDVIVGPVRRPLYLMLGAVGLVLLVACANVGSLLLARGVARRQELTVRTALGASRARLVRMLLTESLLVASLGAAAGALLASWGLPLLLTLAGDALPRAHGVTLNARVLGAVVAMALATGLVSGVTPVAFALRTRVSGLKDGIAGAGTSRWRARFGDGLVVAQVAMTMLLLAGSALLASSFARLVRVDAGYDAAGVVVAQLQLDGDRYATAEQHGAFGRSVLERVRALPGVQAAAVSTGVPLAGGAVGGISVEGRPEGGGDPWAWFTGATEEYVGLLGVPLLRGRALRDTDAKGDAIVVNEALVRAYFRGADPIGRTVTYMGNVTGRIVGVVGDTRQEGLASEAPPQIYIPFPRETSSYLKITVRARDGDAIAASLREVLRGVDPMLPLDGITTLPAMLSESVARERFYAVLLSLFAGTALAIAAIGLYGLTAYTLTRRQRELGIRLALGAGTRRVVWSLVARAGTLGAAGIALGLAGAVASGRVLRAHLFELSPTDPLTLALAAATLAGVALLASWVPARRAARVDPVVVLRSE